jgi:RNA polymerase nonessential primary-like sigma factor
MKRLFWIRKLKLLITRIRRFGLQNHQEETLEQVGREIGLTRERVRQIQVDALRRLGDVLRKHGLSSNLLFADLQDS